MSHYTHPYPTAPSAADQDRQPNRPAVVQPGVPLVTVAVACYNQGRYLASALESVRDQSYPHVEIIVVDDGSTDDTAEVTANYPEVYYIRQENQGLSAARNTGLHAARGEYIVFLDADDRLLPRALEIGALCMAAYSTCSYVSGHFRYIRENGEFLHQFPQTRVHQDHYLELLRGNYIGMHAAVMYRRAVFDEVGGFDTSLPACEDYDLYLRIARRFPVFCHDEVIAEYRQHGSNMSRNPDLMLRQAYQVLDRQRPYLTTEVQRRAYRKGILRWQAFYGYKYFERAAQLRAQGDFWESIPATLPAFVRTPQYAAYHMAEWLWWRMYSVLDRILPAPARRQLAFRLYQIGAPRVGRLHLGDLGKSQPLLRAPGGPQGLWVDQHYKAAFLADQAHYVRGRVLLVDRPESWQEHVGSRIDDVQLLAPELELNEDGLLEDLAFAEDLGENRFDCILMFQTLHRVYDLPGAIYTLYRLLAPGGVLLVTLPGIGLVKQSPESEEGYWAFTEYSARQLFGCVFPADMRRVEAQGNVLAAQALLHGIPAACLQAEELEVNDPQYPLVITVRAMKPHARTWRP